MFLPPEIWNMIYRYLIEYYRSKRFKNGRDVLGWRPLERLPFHTCKIIVRSYIDRKLLEYLILKMMDGDESFGTMLYYEYFVLQVG